VSELILRNVEVDGRRVDVALDGEVVTDVGPALHGRGGDEVDGDGGALIPGLHDHHLHLFAMAAAAASVDGRGDVGRAVRAADASAPAGAWLRVVDWHETDGGELDRHALDALAADRPVRVQHATGALWVLNTPGLEAIGMGDHPDGRLFGMDDVLRERLGATAPDLTEVGRRLTEVGVTAVTDATPFTRLDDVRAIRLSQHVTVMGAPELDVQGITPLRVGPAKIVVADHDPPDVDALAAAVKEARAHGRAMAFHCASRLGLVLALAALDVAGAAPGDRIEHGAVIPDDAVPVLRRMGLTVVTQPGFVAERGDRYLAEVEADDQPFLWRCGSIIDAGIAVRFSSDAPHGPIDPWRAIRAAVDRRTASGQVLGPAEAVTAARALAAYLDGRTVAPGQPADLVLLHVPLAEALAHPDATHVRLTLIAGEVQTSRA
jgi:predicted amidohydrolase YtcJ